MYFLPLLLLIAGGAAAWPETPPNCALTGNWSNYDQSNTVAVWDVQEAVPRETSPVKVFEVEHKHLNQTVSGRSFTRDHRLLGLILTAKNATNGLFTVLGCYNDELWAMQVPLMNNPAVFTRIFTLTKSPVRSRGPR